MENVYRQDIFHITSNQFYVAFLFDAGNEGKDNRYILKVELVFKIILIVQQSNLLVQGFHWTDDLISESFPVNSA